MDSKFAKRLQEALDLRRMAPSDLAERSGVSKASISEYLSGKYEPKQRSIFLLAQALRVDPTALLGIGDLEAEPEIREVPVISIIEKGKPTIIGANVEKYEKTDERNVAFLLRAYDDGMMNARIHRGDLVYVDELALVDNGDIIVVIPEDWDVAIIRRYFRYGGKVVLQPEHPDMIEQSYPPQDLRIIGKVVGARFMLK